LGRHPHFGKLKFLNVCELFVQKCAPGPDVCAHKFPAISKKQSGGGIETRHPLFGNMKLLRCQTFVQKCAPGPDVCAQKLPALSKKQSGETRIPLF